MLPNEFIQRYQLLTQCYQMYLSGVTNCLPSVAECIYPAFPNYSSNVTCRKCCIIHKVETLSKCNGGGRVVRRCWLNFQCQGVLLAWITVGQGPIVLAVGAGVGCLEFFLSSITSVFILPLSGRRPDID